MGYYMALVDINNQRLRYSRPVISAIECTDKRVEIVVAGRKGSGIKQG